MPKYIHLIKNWPDFTWQHEKLVHPLATVRHSQGRLLGKLEGLGFQLKAEASLGNLILDVMKSSEIEGEKLPIDQVRSSIARKLGMKVPGLVLTSRDVDGVVEMMLDATQKHDKPLTKERLFGWHSSLFPAGRSGLHKIQVGAWRDAEGDPMQVVSGAMGKERVHFEAPEAARLEREMKLFLKWFNSSEEIDSILKAAIAHLWFVTIHPFDDGNGRIARAIADMQLSRSDQTNQRFYSMSAQIQQERKAYYDCLEKTQRGTLDITDWLLWFLHCFDRALSASTQNVAGVMNKATFWEKHRTVTLNPRQRTMLNKLMDGFEGKLTSSKWAKMTKSSPDTALRDMQSLMQAKILEKEEGGGRSTSYRINY
ncbi:MAG: Fic family protein [Cyclobacteriaceae bacterium]|nr:Fic family protein [Cyclobacteriaceae bacterium]